MTAFSMRGFQHQTHTMAVERTVEDWLDKLGHFVIGQIDDPNRTEWLDEYRSALRKTIETEKREAEAKILR